MQPADMQRLEDAHLAGAQAHDTEAIGAVWHEAGFYESMALGLRFARRQAVTAYYTAVFTTFPDFFVTIDGTAYGNDTLAEWGHWEGTMNGAFFGIPPTGRNVRVPLAAIISFRDGKIEGERNFFDLATLCDQAGVDLQAALTVARELRPA